MATRAIVARKRVFICPPYALCAKQGNDIAK
jgi:hypothetical protein